MVIMAESFSNHHHHSSTPVQNLLPPVDAEDNNDDDDDDGQLSDADKSACSSLTSGSGETFHVFTDAASVISNDFHKFKSNNNPAVFSTRMYGAERELLQSEREQLHKERLKLAEERKELEAERRRLRALEETTDGGPSTGHGHHAGAAKSKKKKDTKERKQRASSMEQLNGKDSKEEQIKRRASKQTGGVGKGKPNELAATRCFELDHRHTMHEIRSDRPTPPDRISGPNDVCSHDKTSTISDTTTISNSSLVVPYTNSRGPIGSLSRTSNHSLQERIVGASPKALFPLASSSPSPPQQQESTPEEESIDIVAEAPKVDEEQKIKEKERRQTEEEHRIMTLEKARQKMQEDRKLRQQMIRERIVVEEAEAKLKMQKKKEEAQAQALAAAKQAEFKKVVDNSDKARAQRAYSWYSKLAQPSRDAFKKRIGSMKNLDIVAEDVDLLPWNAMGTMVNVAKLNALLYSRS